MILSRVYAWFGLMGFAYFGILLSVLVSIVLFATCFALSRRFWRSWLLTLLGAFTLRLLPLSPVLFSSA